MGTVAELNRDGGAEAPYAPFSQVRCISRRALRLFVTSLIRMFSKFCLAKLPCEVIILAASKGTSQRCNTPGRTNDGTACTKKRFLNQNKFGTTDAGALREGADLNSVNFMCPSEDRTEPGSCLPWPNSCPGRASWNLQVLLKARGDHEARYRKQISSEPADHRRLPGENLETQRSGTANSPFTEWRPIRRDRQGDETKIAG